MVVGVVGGVVVESGGSGSGSSGVVVGVVEW